MRDPRRIERILALIKEIWILVPDQRLGQLLGNYGLYEARQGPMWWIEDTDTEARLRAELARMAEVMVARRSPTDADDDGGRAGDEQTAGGRDAH